MPCEPRCANLTGEIKWDGVFGVGCRGVLAALRKAAGTPRAVDGLEVLSVIVNVEGVVWSKDKVLLVRRSEQEDYMPGVLSLPGGKVEAEKPGGDILENTLRRELKEEVGISVSERMVYLESKLFYAHDMPAVDVVFSCRHKDGTARPEDKTEVSEVKWLKVDHVLQRPGVPPWTRRSIELAARFAAGTAQG